jgi:hypothetical protein
MADKGRLSVEHIKTVWFFTETKIVVVTHRQFCAFFKRIGHLHSKKFRNFITSLMMMIAISSHGLLGPVFFEETVNNEHYLSMLCNTFVPHLLATGLPLQTQ